MKYIILIGDEVNAKKFREGLSAVKLRSGCYQIDNDRVDIRYYANVARAVNVNCSAYIVVNSNDGRIPKSVEAHLPKLPSDHVYFYTADKRPENFLHGFLRKLTPIQTVEDKLRLFLLGKFPFAAEKVERSLRIEFAAKRKTPA